MKTALCLFSMMFAIPAFAATPNQVQLIKQDLEVTSIISAFETKRSEKCNAIEADQIKLGHDGAAKVTVSCNQYDKDGEPMANVYVLTLKGQLYDTFFDLQSVKIEGQE